MIFSLGKSPTNLYIANIIVGGFSRGGGGGYVPRGRGGGRGRGRGGGRGRGRGANLGMNGESSA